MIAGNNIGDWDRNAIRDHYENDENVRAFLDKMAARERAPRVTTVDSLQSDLDMSRNTAIEVLRKLARARGGRFKTGRRGHESRIEWLVSAIQVAKHARQATGHGAVPASAPEEQSVEYVEQQFRLRPNAVAVFKVPVNTTKEEAEKLAGIVRNLWW